VVAGPPAQAPDLLLWPAHWRDGPGEHDTGAPAIGEHPGSIALVSRLNARWRGWPHSTPLPSGPTAPGGRTDGLPSVLLLLVLLHHSYRRSAFHLVAASVSRCQPPLPSGQRRRPWHPPRPGHCSYTSSFRRSWSDSSLGQMLERVKEVQSQPGIYPERAGLR